MKRLTLPILLLLALALAACGGTTATPAIDSAAITGTLAPDDAAPPDQPETFGDETGDEVQQSPPTNDDQTNDDPAAAAATNDVLTDPTLVRERDHRLGPDGAPVTIIEYADFQCPSCATFGPVLKDLSARFPEDVQIVYRHFPLTSIHPLATLAAEASEAAATQDAFWPYNEALYAQQAEWSRLPEDEARAFFVTLAESLGLDAAQFREELEGGVHTEYVNQLEQEAIQLGLPGTPSAIVNGEIVPGEGLPRDLAVWEEFVSSEKALQDLAARQYSAAPEMTIDTNARYLARVEMESGNTFTIELLPQSAPQTVNSFVFLAREGWFDGVTFHRVLPGFVAQTGDPSGTGRGGPGYMLPNEIDPALSHDGPGIVAMANAGPNTNGSQWYITYGDVSQLDGSYTIFGRVTEGMNVVEGITPRDPQRQPNAAPGDRIVSITIEEIK